MNYEKTIFDCSVEGRVGFQLPPFDLASTNPMEGVSEKLVRTSEIRLPQVSELDVVRHYTKLSMKNHGVETGMYPLGSCTMKYNPKINEKLASYEEFSELHPLVPSSFAQGSLELLYRLQ
ncbi:MAG: aminomethyl-transferring glycine dehydrogenase subunit GcvPB, partial [Vallitaleaceae bacterium]|nr:aminomethyl-transferring glycine dehydrogenase subunit GcvPB [Vallitaleaceae bacterium]